MKGLLFLISTIIICAAETAGAGWLGPTSYDECITESMKGVQSDLAAKAIIQSCRNQFSTSKTKTLATIPNECLNKLTGRATIDTNSISGNIYNGCREWTITSITIAIKNNNIATTGNFFDKFDNNESHYIVESNFSPLTTTRFYIPTNQNNGNNPSWNITAALGYKG